MFNIYHTIDIAHDINISYKKLIYILDSKIVRIWIINLLFHNLMKKYYVISLYKSLAKKWNKDKLSDFLSLKLYHFMKKIVSFLWRFCKH